MSAITETQIKELREQEVRHLLNPITADLKDRFSGKWDFINRSEERNSLISHFAGDSALSSLDDLKDPNISIPDSFIHVRAKSDYVQGPITQQLLGFSNKDFTLKFIVAVKDHDGSPYVASYRVKEAQKSLELDGIEYEGGFKYLKPGSDR